MQSKRWTIKEVDELKSKNLANSLKIHPALCAILVQRGITTFEEAKAFFRPNLDDLHDPMSMKDMDKAVSRIDYAMLNKQKILIYGDYDVDGTTSVALMYLFLKEIYDDLQYYIPDRYAEGYGISLQGIDVAAQNGVQLIIALDCGVTAVTQVEYATKLGIDFIICDHHLPSDSIPDAVAVLDPKRIDCSYPFKELSGAGVGFKLCTALTTHFDLPKSILFQYLDLVAVSIASDIVPVVGENRIIAYFGLEKLVQNPIIGLKVLKNLSKLEGKKITVTDVVFSLGPKINAPGRMAHAKASVEMLIVDDEAKAYQLAEKLDLVNTERRVTDEQITGEAMNTLDHVIDLTGKKTIVLSDATWSKGVIGIVASRLVEKYYRPTIVFSEKDAVLTGSARSIKGFSIYDGLKQCSQHLIQFGGHEFAAGVSLKKENLESFKDSFEAAASRMIAPEMLQPEIEIDLNLSFADITDTFYKILEQMGPFGPQNMQPIFRTCQVRDAGGTRLVGKNDAHVKFNLKDDTGKVFNGIAFGLGSKYTLDDIKSHQLNICYCLNINDFNGNQSIELSIKDIQIID